MALRKARPSRPFPNFRVTLRQNRTTVLALPKPPPRPADDHFAWLTPPGVAALSLLWTGHELFFRAFGCHPAPEVPSLCSLRDGAGLVLDRAVVAPAAQGWLVCSHGGPVTRQLLTHRLEQAGGCQSSVDNLWNQPERLSKAALADLAAIRGETGAALLLTCAQCGPQLIREALGLTDEFLLPLISAWAEARFLYYLPRVQLWGPVNAGKSSLLNELCGQELARAGELPGLTRDVIEGTVDHRGCLLRLFDAPGLAKGAAAIDTAAYELAEQWRKEADLTLELVPPGQDPSSQPGHLVYFSRADQDPRGRKPGVSVHRPASLGALKDRLVEKFLGRLLALPQRLQVALPKTLLDELATGTQPRKILQQWL